jgi:hypothetical protein
MSSIRNRQDQAREVARQQIAHPSEALGRTSTSEHSQVKRDFEFHLWLEVTRAEASRMESRPLGALAPNQQAPILAEAEQAKLNLDVLTNPKQLPPPVCL